MFDDYCRINCRSQDSASKRTVKTSYSLRKTIPRKYTETPISKDDRGSQKGRQKWARRGPHHP
jgi:hypothetical protein